MIDKIARRRAAEVIRHFLSGRITNEEFEDRYPTSRDPVVWALDDTLWNFYSDFEEHTLSGRHSVPKELKGHLSRWLLFLYTEKEYGWPNIASPGLRRYYQPSWLSRVTRFAGYVEKRTGKFMSHGEYDFWPFLSRKDFEEARTRPILLNGHIQHALGADSPLRSD